MKIGTTIIHIFTHVDREEASVHGNKKHMTMIL